MFNAHQPAKHALCALETADVEASSACDSHRQGSNMNSLILQSRCEAGSLEQQEPCSFRQGSDSAVVLHQFALKTFVEPWKHSFHQDKLINLSKDIHLNYCHWKTAVKNPVDAKE
eukprot:1160827-Pelagomonas_calceolata.AAC.7